LDVAAGVLLLDDQTTRTASLAPRLILSGGVLAGNGCLTIQELLDWRAGWIGRGQDDFGGVFLGTTTMIEIDGPGAHVLAGYLANEGGGHVAAGSTLVVTDSGAFVGTEGRLLVEGSLAPERGATITQREIELVPGV
jgi:hypothetical protein